MATIDVSLKDLPKQIEKDMKAREARIDRSLYATVRASVPIAQAHAPVAFNELRASIHPEGKQLVADAPHSEAVENGSRPHWPPLAPLVAWVKLRGMQGVGNGTPEGPTGAGHAANVAGQIAARGNSVSTPVDAAVQVARAIQRAIAMNGTKPTFFMGSSIPDITGVLDRLVTAALPDP